MCFCKKIYVNTIYKYLQSLLIVSKKNIIITHVCMSKTWDFVNTNCY